MSTLQLGEKGVEMWLYTTNRPSQILHDGTILGYTNLIDGQYIFWLKDKPELSAIANIVEIKRVAKLVDIEFWYFGMGHLGYRSLKTLKNLSTTMDFKETAPKNLCGNCQKDNQTCEPSKISMSQFTKFLGCLYSDLKRPFP